MSLTKLLAEYWIRTEVKDMNVAASGFTSVDRI